VSFCANVVISSADEMIRCVAVKDLPYGSDIEIKCVAVQSQK
jgi:N-acetylglutamate synthase-like GNAT family acetyltransferase